MAEFTNLEPTAALVMLWAHDLYQTGSAGRFYACLDMSAGRELREACERICPWYRQVTLNRKWFVRHLAEEFIATAKTPSQVLVVASGKSPVVLELLDACSDRICSVIELDIMGMEEKQRLYGQVAPGHAGKIRCIPADLCDLAGTRRAIEATGRYDPDLPTCVIAEGISYYIPPAALSGILSLFSSPEKKNHVVLEYMLPCRLVSEERRYIPHGIRRIIKRDCHPGGTVTYSPEEMDQALTRAGCDRVVHYPLCDIELQRTGARQFFPTGPDGWIQIVAGRL